MMYNPALDPDSCENCINWRAEGDAGCHGEIYRYCRGGNPKHKRFFNVDVRRASEQRKKELRRLYGP